MDKPRPRSGRVVAYLVAGVIFVAGVGPFFGFWRAAIAFAVAAPVLAVGIGYFRSAGNSPPDAEAEELTGADLRYVCSVCGLELKVIVATNDKAPTHCREKMDLVPVGGKPPLKPV
ncbi:MAG: hypothetical protein KY391_00440 [Actinobacteria bacterium]|nr:hypothetical protein [Actinomycetota bacterium]